MYTFTSSMLFVLYADSNPSDGQGITSTRDVIALMSRSVRAIVCCTDCITLDEVSFKFLNKLPAPPLIDENENSPPAALELIESCATCCGGGGGAAALECCGQFRTAAAGEFVGRGGGALLLRFAAITMKNLTSTHPFNRKRISSCSSHNCTFG